MAGHSSLTTASTTHITTTGNLWVNGFATTTASTGAFATQSTLTVAGHSSITTASTTHITTTGNLWVNGFATTTAATGAIATQGDLTVQGDGTVSGGTLTLTTTNAATSTAVIGCIQTYASSTATPIKQMFYASSTLGITGEIITAGFGGGTQQGLVLWGFGTCP